MGFQVVISGKSKETREVFGFICPERRYGAISMALKRVSSVIEQEPFVGRCLWYQSRLQSALNENFRLTAKPELW